MEVWCKSETLLFIKLFKHFPCLYNPADHNFNNKKFKNQKYAYILKELQKRTKRNFIIQNLKQKYRTLASQVSKEKKTIRNFLQSRNDKTAIYKPRLWCFHELAFLFCIDNNSPKTIKDTNCLENFEEIRLPEEVNTNNLIEEHLDSSTVFIKGTEQISASQISIDIRLENEVNHTKNEIKQSSQHLHNFEGRNEIFCKYLATELKRLKYEDLFYELKMDILQVVRDKVKKQKFILNKDIITV